MDDALNTARRAPARIRITPTVAADYQARNVFPELRPPDGEHPGRYFTNHTVSRALAQAIFDDAVGQAARCGSLERRNLTLAYRSLASRTSLNFCKRAWHWSQQDAACPDPCDFREQAPVVDALLHTVATTKGGKRA